MKYLLLCTLLLPLAGDGLKTIPRHRDRMPEWCQNTHGDGFGGNGYAKNCSCRRQCGSEIFYEPEKYPCITAAQRCRCDHGCPK